MPTASQVWRAFPTSTPVADVICWNPCGNPDAITNFSIAKIADGSAGVPATAYSGMRQVTGTTATVTMMIQHTIGAPIRVVACVSPTESFSNAMRREYVCPSGSTTFPVPPNHWVGFSAYDTSETFGFATSTLTPSNVTTRQVSFTAFTLGLTGGGA
jgi:hypothetical protein